MHKAFDSGLELDEDAIFCDGRNPPFYTRVGRIHLDNVVPGDYKVFAWEVVESNAWTDADFLRNYENNGAAVRITEGGRAAADVQVIPYKAN